MIACENKRFNPQCSDKCYIRNMKQANIAFLSRTSKFSAQIAGGFPVRIFVKFRKNIHSRSFLCYNECKSAKGC